MMINCDMGERGINSPEDLELMKLIDIANIACGGHSGDRQSVDFYSDYARAYKVKLSAHLSYPDKENFGRISMKLPMDEFIAALDRQYSLMDSINTVKFHGALYNDSCRYSSLAESLVFWMKSVHIREIICPENSFIADYSRDSNIHVIGEAFAERTYTFNISENRLMLTGRDKDYAVIKDVYAAVEQVHQIENSHMVTAFVDDGISVSRTDNFPINAQTVCIHSDSTIALDLARRLCSDE